MVTLLPGQESPIRSPGALMGDLLLPPLPASPVLPTLSSQRGLSKPQILPHHPLMQVQTPGLGFRSQPSRPGPGWCLQPHPHLLVHMEHFSSLHCVASPLWAFAQVSAFVRNVPHSFFAWLTPTHPSRPKAGITSTGKTSQTLSLHPGSGPWLWTAQPFLGDRSK